MTWIWLNIPAAALFVGLWAGVPLWMVLRHPDVGPDGAAAPAAATVRARRAERAEAAYRRLRYRELASAAGQR
jgi:hypothetical protein